MEKHDDELEIVPNGFISSVICDNEDEVLRELDLHYIFVADEETQSNVATEFSPTDTHEIHIVENRETPAKPSNEETIINKIKRKIMELCNVKNIVIYVLLANSSVKHNNFIRLFNEFLRTTLPDKYYSNIIIFNFFDPKNISFSDSTPVYIQYDLCNKYCLANINKITDNSKKLFQVSNVTCNPKKSLFIQQDSSKNAKYIYKFIHLTDLYDYDQLKFLITERRCSSGKLIQFSGTCWINTILNALLLPKMSRKYMIEQCRKNISTDPVKNKTNLNNIYKSRDKLTYNNILSSIIYNIFIKKELPSKLKKGIETDFILTFADKIKRIWAIKNEQYLTQSDVALLRTNKVKFGQGGDVACSVSSLTEILSNYLKDFQYTYRAFLFEIPVKFTKEEIKKINPPHLEKRIKKGSSYYQLTSCILSQQKGKHVICGFICEDKEYIYNSNLRTAVECNWTNYDYQPYIDFCKNGKYDNPGILYMEVTIYTLETPDDIKENETAQEEVEEAVSSFVTPDIVCPNFSSSSASRSSTPRSPIARPSPTIPNKTKKCPRDNQELVDGKCRVKCREGQIRNPLTGRCIKNKTVKCPRSDQELINGKCYVKCKPNQTRNPETGRCKKTIKFLPF